MYGGHLSSDPNAATASPSDVTAHLYFFMVKARRTADKERILFWLNVSSPSNTSCPSVRARSSGGSRMLVV